MIIFGSETLERASFREYRLEIGKSEASSESSLAASLRSSLPYPLPLPLRLPAGRGGHRGILPGATQAKEDTGMWTPPCGPPFQHISYRLAWAQFSASEGATQHLAWVRSECLLHNISSTPFLPQKAVAARRSTDAIRLARARSHPLPPSPAPATNSPLRFLP